MTTKLSLAQETPLGKFFFLNINVLFFLPSASMLNKTEALSNQLQGVNAVAFSAALCGILKLVSRPPRSLGTPAMS